MTDYSCIVSTAVDLSRVTNRNPYVEIQLRRLLAVGREVDLLEALRRSDKKEKVTIEKILIHATGLGLDSQLVESGIIPSFQEHRMLDIYDTEVVLNYTDTGQVYNYGTYRISEHVTKNEADLAQLICKCTRAAIPLVELDEILDQFPKSYREGIKKFLYDSNILKTFDQKGTTYIVSARIYKDEKRFREAMEILTDNKFGNILDFLSNNPANPLPVVEQYLHADNRVIKALTQSGIIDPVRLNVKGDAKDYLFPCNLLNQRGDKDHFDLVRKTLANFRFGEYYSEKTRLFDLDAFFSKLLRHGYAGKAEAIGTDYVNLEWAGIFRIEKIGGSNDYRFWVLKKDVIEDARSILKGQIPLQSDLHGPSLSSIEGVVKARGNIGVQLDPSSMKGITNALRDIERGLTS